MLILRSNIVSILLDMLYYNREKANAKAIFLPDRFLKFNVLFTLNSDKDQREYSLSPERSDSVNVL